MQNISETEVREMNGPEALYGAAKEVDALRIEFMFGETDGLCFEAEQHLLLALSALEQARCWLQLAGGAQARSLSGSRR